MTEEIINPTPKQTEYIVTLPDREKQWEKCPAIGVLVARHSVEVTGNLRMLRCFRKPIVA